MRKAFRCIKQRKLKICYVSLGIDNIYPLKLYLLTINLKKYFKKENK